MITALTKPAGFDRNVPKASSTRSMGDEPGQIDLVGGGELQPALGALARVIAEQAAATTNRRLAALLRYARFPYRRTIDEFDFDFQPSVDRKLVADLASLRIITEARSIAFLGQPGCGKTHLAVALDTLPVEAGYRGYFSTADDMVVALGRARLDGTWAAKLRTYTAPTVLVIDDVGPLPMARDTANSFFHVISHRYEKHVPTLVTTNRSPPG